MDCDLRQWKLQQHQSEDQQHHHLHQQQQHCAKIPRLLLEQPHQEPSFASALPLFVPDSNNKMSSLSAFPDSTTTRLSGMGMGSLFSSAQWQELELQALIFKYMLAGAPIPAELLQPLIKKSFLHTPSAAAYLYPYPQYQHYQPAMLQSGYWGRNAVDPEPGRCRRTDGKKWRCSKEIVIGHKYCERHVHRGRNRSRKLVETATPTVIEGGLKPPTPVAALPIKALAMGNSHSTNLIQFNHRALENKTGNGGLLEMQNGNLCGDGGSDGQLLRQFFDDWPRSNEASGGVGRNGGPSRTCLSISTPGDVSDFSLKLSTGNGEEGLYHDAGGREERAHLDWGAGWSAHQVSSMGGPLAEALRSATSNESPTSVLYELHRGTASETSSVST